MDSSSRMEKGWRGEKKKTGWAIGKKSAETEGRAGVRCRNGQPASSSPQLKYIPDLLEGLNIVLVTSGEDLVAEPL
ncbi:uncharacterized protein N7479_009942 [Penicillium vulpinum]|nr:uncharacterized protein N7479_009942 [Penicillium vulpinum]KAJ5951529.1 hypothetical protein N7479_009942 [Penicillium vulpinum]